jgi:hypothetical protein
MIPTTVFSMGVMRLDFFAGPDEDDHQGEEADGGEDE